jgi:hypothetical protein
MVQSPRSRCSACSSKLTCCSLEVRLGQVLGKLVSAHAVSRGPDARVSSKLSFIAFGKMAPRSEVIVSGVGVCHLCCTLSWSVCTSTANVLTVLFTVLLSRWLAPLRASTVALVLQPWHSVGQIPAYTMGGLEVTAPLDGAWKGIDTGVGLQNLAWCQHTVSTEGGGSQRTSCCVAPLPQECSSLSRAR